MARSSGVTLQVVGKSGQISLGKSYAGKTLRLQHREDGSILITSVAVVPEPVVDDRGARPLPHRARMEWAAKTAPAETEMEVLLKRRTRTPERTRRARRK
jgi:hypothetical protein